MRMRVLYKYKIKINAGKGGTAEKHNKTRVDCGCYHQRYHHYLIRGATRLAKYCVILKAGQKISENIIICIISRNMCVLKI